MGSPWGGNGKGSGTGTLRRAAQALLIACASQNGIDNLAAKSGCATCDETRAGEERSVRAG